MKKLTRLVYSITALLLIGQLNAAPVSFTKATLVAENFYRHHIQEAVGNAQVAYRMSASRGGQTALYVVNVNNGFVVVSGDDRMVPVLGYSDQGNFEESSCPIQLMELLKSYREAFEAITANVPGPDEELAMMWDNMATDIWRDVQRGTPVVEPLLTNNNWQQNNGYNYYCPADANGPAGHTYVGCVALAMGQVMHYWQHPTKGNGSHSYECNHSSSQAGNYPDYGTLTANFGNTTYNFSLMPNYLDGSTPSNQILAVAKLLYHCGVAVDMFYGPEGSMAFHDDIAEALEQYFKYDSCLTLWQNSYSGNWDELLKADLDAGRPIIYCAYANEGGHEFVCDGYDDQDFFHFNWGWGGLHNGYFRTSNMNPSYVFNSSHGVVAHIQPKSDVGVADHKLMAPVVYPNPASEVVTVQADGMTSVEIVDLLGRTILRTTTEGESVTLPVNHIAPGTYVFRVRYQDDSCSESKLIIQ